MNGYPETDIPIRLLIIESSLNEAEAHISTLRNAGLVVHPTVAVDDDALLDIADNEKPELILLSLTDTTDKLTATLKLCRAAFHDAPYVILYKNPETDPDTLLQIMRDGARDVVCTSDPDHLQLVVMRESENLSIRKELALTQQKLKEAEARCNTLIASSQDAIAYIHEGMHMQANPAYLQMFGYVDMGELEGLPILDMIPAKDHKSIKAFLRTLGNEHAELNIACQNSAGETFDAKLEFSPATYDGEPCTQLVIRNEAQNKELEQTIELLSNQDAQTGLANRQYFMAKMEQQIATLRETGGGCSLFYIVIDDFREIRAEIGITASDNLLKELAGILSRNIDKSDLLSRFGDHSFTILSTKQNPIDAETMAERLRLLIEEFVYQQTNVTCCIGISLLDQEITGSQDFINRAYHAYEAARNSGGNRYSLYDASEMQASYGEDNTGDEARINELIQHALENDRFRLVYQPIVSLQGDSREHYAVLTRLLDNNNEEILPDYFIRHAKQGEQMAKVDRWVINKAIEELAEQRTEGKKVNFFISISSAGLEDEGMLLWICDCLRKHRAKGPWITFQIQDKELRNHIQTAKKLIEGLKKIKCQLAIDQFGASPKAETLLKHLPVDFVKFDFELMQDLASKQEQQDHLNELNALAKQHNIKTIAMGVEDANSLAILWTVGVNYIQGYFLQEPSENISYEFSSA
ncbi:EAL domain-containing protein [Sedimenticola selenatireducens]|uniref:GGDEF domain-containing protein n=1 Tax=Sedimenticola selenatireducens TaxID=191960 RepID=A0A2N6CR84_9GAMM|nr:EAL domain-containing protein [Sedimenticola selenatireducens]PLX59567.1 MAG: GGDEF domain-containing protein [Sedimenticola selenatireducens]